MKFDTYITRYVIQIIK